MTDQDDPNDPEFEVRECPDCEREKEIAVYADRCASCAEARAFAQIEAPEGGWPAGSDMDRI